MKEEMVARASQVYAMPLVNGMVILHPELAVVKFGLSETLDIGMLCYSKRAVLIDIKRNSNRKVVLESLLQSRIEHVRRLLDHISSYSEKSGLRMRTLSGHFNYLIRFVNWADANRWPDVLSGVDATKPAMRAYFDHVRESVISNKINLNSGAKLQRTIVRIMEEFFEEEDLGRGLHLLKMDKGIYESTSPPSEKDQGRVLSLCDSLFEGICNLVIDRSPYPYALAMPGHLGFPDSRLWLFPAQAWFKTPAMVAGSFMHSGYDYTEGRLASRDEVKIQYPRKNRVNEVISKVKIQLKRANEDNNDHHRWHLARKAFNSFVIMFIAATGMNWAQAVNLVWSDAYEVATTNQGFRAIKWRAGGKIVSFELPINFLPKFRRFLALRAYVLQGKQCEYFFLLAQKHQQSRPQLGQVWIGHTKCYAL